MGFGFVQAGLLTGIGNALTGAGKNIEDRRKDALETTAKLAAEQRANNESDRRSNLAHENSKETAKQLAADQIKLLGIKGTQALGVVKAKATYDTAEKTVEYERSKESEKRDADLRVEVANRIEKYKNDNQGAITEIKIGADGAYYGLNTDRTTGRITTTPLLRTNGQPLIGPLPKGEDPSADAVVSASGGAGPATAKPDPAFLKFNESLGSIQSEINKRHPNESSDYRFALALEAASRPYGGIKSLPKAYREQYDAALSASKIAKAK